jgi:hypothetical protein
MMILLLACGREPGEYLPDSGPSPCQDYETGHETLGPTDVGPAGFTATEVVEAMDGILLDATYEDGDIPAETIGLWATLRDGPIVSAHRDLVAAFADDTGWLPEGRCLRGDLIRLRVRASVCIEGLEGRQACLTAPASVEAAGLDPGDIAIYLHHGFLEEALPTPVFDAVADQVGDDDFELQSLTMTLEGSLAASRAWRLEYDYYVDDEAPGGMLRRGSYASHD